MLAFYNMNFRFARKKGGSGLAITHLFAGAIMLIASEHSGSS